MVRNQILSSKIEDKARISSLSAPVNIILEGPISVVRLEKEIKTIQIGKKNILFRDSITVYVKYTKYLSRTKKKFLELINEYENFMEYKVNI